MDNPLIGKQYIADISWIDRLAVDASDCAKAVMNEFMPDLSRSFSKVKGRTDEVTAGLDSVEYAFQVIPLQDNLLWLWWSTFGGPSANTSTKISPTSARSTYLSDMQTRVPLDIARRSVRSRHRIHYSGFDGRYPDYFQRPGATATRCSARVLGACQILTKSDNCVQSRTSKYTTRP